MDDHVYDPLVEKTNLHRDADGRLRIRIPERANIALDTVGRFARGSRSDHPALVYEQPNGELITYTFADFLPEFDVVLRRAWLAGDFDFSAVPLCGRWGWRRRARLAGYR